ncbi:hypothetical protein IG631_23338 [Alternaria alternata]|nr:hypothetical protein IG631_23338 [Alternaria alternata]
MTNHIWNHFPATGEQADCGASLQPSLDDICESLFQLLIMFWVDLSHDGNMNRSAMLHFPVSRESILQTFVSTNLTTMPHSYQRSSGWKIWSYLRTHCHLHHTTVSKFLGLSVFPTPTKHSDCVSTSDPSIFNEEASHLLDTSSNGFSRDEQLLGARAPKQIYHGR